METSNITAITIQIVACFCAFMGMGQALGEKSTKFDKIAGWSVCFVFVCLAIFVQGVMIK